MPCASGEEPLTIAMMLDQAGWFERAAIEVHGSDGSPAAIARARSGRYRERSFRTLPEKLRDRYFTRDGDVWMPQPRLSERIGSWSVVNLMAPDRSCCTHRPGDFAAMCLFISLKPRFGRS